MDNKKETVIRKLKKVTVKTQDGDKEVVMAPISVDTTRELTNVICTECCPYGKVCGKLRHPAHLEDKGLTLNDWCVELSFTDEKMTEVNELGSYYPMAGEVEKLYPDNSEPLQQLLEENPIIRLNEFIDKVCSGFCDQYNPEHSNCSFDNQTCICRELFLRTEKSLVVNANSDKINVDTESESSQN